MLEESNLINNFEIHFKIILRTQISYMRDDFVWTDRVGHSTDNKLPFESLMQLPVPGFKLTKSLNFKTKNVHRYL